MRATPRKREVLKRYDTPKGVVLANLEYFLTSSESWFADPRSDDPSWTVDAVSRNTLMISRVTVSI